MNVFFLCHGHVFNEFHTFYKHKKHSQQYHQPLSILMHLNPYKPTPLENSLFLLKMIYRAEKLIKDVNFRKERKVGGKSSEVPKITSFKTF